MNGAKRIPLLVVLLVVQLLLAWWLALPADRGVQAQARLLDFDIAVVNQIDIADGERREVVLKMGDDGWYLPGHFDFPVPAERVADLLQQLAGLKPTLAVATSLEAADRFRVSEKVHERRIRLLAGDQLQAEFYLGDAAGPRRAYVRVAGEPAIYPVDFTALDAPAHVGGWTEKSYLYQPAEGLEQVSVGPLILKRVKDAWQLADLAADEHMDATKADALVQRLLNLNFMAVAGKAADLPEGETVLTAQLVYGDGRTVDYRFTDPGQQGDPLLRVTGLAHVLRIGSYAVDPLKQLQRQDLLQTVVD